MSSWIENVISITDQLDNIGHYQTTHFVDF
jgi:hypothetical protein